MVQKSRGPGSGVVGAAVSTATNLDGSYFGTSFPQIFITTFENMMEQPPRVYLYEPKICGFNIVGQRGSKYFDPQQVSAYKRLDKNEKTENRCKNPACSQKNKNS